MQPKKKVTEAETIIPIHASLERPKKPRFLPLSAPLSAESNSAEPLPYGAVAEARDPVIRGNHSLMSQLPKFGLTWSSYLPVELQSAPLVAELV